MGICFAKLKYFIWNFCLIHIYTRTISILIFRDKEKKSVFFRKVKYFTTVAPPLKYSIMIIQHIFLRKLKRISIVELSEIFGIMSNQNASAVSVGELVMFLWHSLPRYGSFQEVNQLPRHTVSTNCAYFLMHIHLQL